jgi:RNA polymerase sigma-70 factor (ECF subfamily)
VTGAGPPDRRRQPGPFEVERPRLLGLAYRILGSLVDAEDVVQEAWLRWNGADQQAIERPGAWLTTVTTRLAIDRMRSAASRRESYVGPWLPEPLIVEAGPEASFEAAETLTLGFLSALETLEPLSRVVFLLADVFGCTFAEVSAATGKSPAACRQIAVRARAKLRGATAGRTSRGDRQLADRLMAAVTAGDMKTAVSLMAEDVILVTDGGPNRHAARRPVVGPQRVWRFMAGVAKRIPPTVVFEAAMVNGQAGFRVCDPDGVNDAAMAFEVTAGRVSAIWAVTNPDKLNRLDSPTPIA